MVKTCTSPIGTLNDVDMVAICQNYSPATYKPLFNEQHFSQSAVLWEHVSLPLPSINIEATVVKDRKTRKVCLIPEVQN